MALSWSRIAGEALRAAVRAGVRSLGGSRSSTRARPSAGRRPDVTGSRPTYPGDHRGPARIDYRPRADGRADPGEVVWTWVPYEEDHSRGKDRPVLVVGQDGPWLLVLMLSSKDHSGPGTDEADEARHGRRWLELGPGPWDRQGRASGVRTDRVVRVDPSAVRREGAQLDRARFERVASALRTERGWT